MYNVTADVNRSMPEEQSCPCVCDSDSIQQEIQHLGKTFQANSYPDRVLDPILKQNLSNVRQPAHPTTEENAEKKILCLPYVKVVTEKIDRVCRNIKTANLKLISKPHWTIRQTLVNVKNRVPEEKKTGVVYEVPCHDCDHVYVRRRDRSETTKASVYREYVACSEDMKDIW